MKILRLPMSIAAAVCAAFILSGCETESADATCVTISPDYAKISSSQSVTLTAHGWDNFAWSSTGGHLSATKGKSVVFRPTEGGKTYTVTASALTGSGASGSSSSGSGTNSVSVAVGDGAATIVVY